MTLTFYDTDIPWHWQFRARMIFWVSDKDQQLNYEIAVITYIYADGNI